MISAPLRVLIRSSSSSVPWSFSPLLQPYYRAFSATTASADFSPALTAEISPGKVLILSPRADRLYLTRLGGLRASLFPASSPPTPGLTAAFCSFSQGFAYRFLQLHLAVYALRFSYGCHHRLREVRFNFHRISPCWAHWGGPSGPRTGLLTRPRSRARRPSADQKIRPTMPADVVSWLKLSSLRSGVLNLEVLRAENLRLRVRKAGASSVLALPRAATESNPTPAPDPGIASQVSEDGTETTRAIRPRDRRLVFISPRLPGRAKAARGEAPGLESAGEDSHR